MSLIPIVYADDDCDDVELLSDAFSSYSPNINLITAGNGSDAWQLLLALEDTGTVPCLIILDINMPLINGKQLLQRLRERQAFEHTSIILFSTSNTQEDHRFAEQHKAILITKPLEQWQLNKTVEQFIDCCPQEVRLSLQPRN